MSRVDIPMASLTTLALFRRSETSSAHAASLLATNALFDASFVNVSRFYRILFCLELEVYTGWFRLGSAWRVNKSHTGMLRPYLAEVCRAEGSRRGGQGGKPEGLASLFEPPHDLIFNGNFEEAKQAALGQNKWLARLQFLSLLC
jgi:hypothetical protein